MAMQVLCLVFIVMVANLPLGHTVQIEISPREIVQVNQAVNVSCIPDDDEVTDITMIALNKEGSKEIVKVLPGRDVQYSSEVLGDVKISGHVALTANENSFLTMTLLSPNVKDNGRYTCDLYHVDSQSVLQVSSDSAYLTVFDLESTKRIKKCQETVARQSEIIEYISGTATPWTMVFRATAGIGVRVFDAWNNNGQWGSMQTPTTEEMLACLGVGGKVPCKTHLRSSHLDTWDNINQVKVAMYKAGIEVFYITFRADGTRNRNEFFKVERVIDSSVPELINYKGEHNYFTSDGFDPCRRRFYISKLWNGCPNDLGWLMVSDKSDPNSHLCCSFDKPASYPVFYYTKEKTPVNMNDKSHLGEADVFAVWVKFNDAE